MRHPFPWCLWLRQFVCCFFSFLLLTFQPTCCFLWIFFFFFLSDLENFGFANSNPPAKSPMFSLHSLHISQWIVPASLPPMCSTRSWSPWMLGLVLYTTDHYHWIRAWYVVRVQQFNDDWQEIRDVKDLSSVQFSRSVMSDSLQPHESQHTRPPCPSPTPGVHSNSCPSSRMSI